MRVDAKMLHTALECSLTCMLFCRHLQPIAASNNTAAASCSNEVYRSTPYRACQHMAARLQHCRLCWLRSR